MVEAPVAVQAIAAVRSSSTEAVLLGGRRYNRHCRSFRRFCRRRRGGGGGGAEKRATTEVVVSSYGSIAVTDTVIRLSARMAWPLAWRNGDHDEAGDNPTSCKRFVMKPCQAAVGAEVPPKASAAENGKPQTLDGNVIISVGLWAGSPHMGTRFVSQFVVEHGCALLHALMNTSCPRNCFESRFEIQQPIVMPRPYSES